MTIGPGHTRDVEHFQLPALHEYTNATRVYSDEADSYAKLPWPHDLHACQLKEAPNIERNDDRQPLAADGEEPYDDFFEARAFLIHNEHDYHRPEVRQDSVMIRLVEGVGWINEITGSGRQYTAIVDGLQFMDCRVELKSRASADQARSNVAVRSHRVLFTLGSAPWPPLTFIMYRDSREWDRRVYTPREAQEELPPAAQGDPLPVAGCSSSGLVVVDSTSADERADERADNAAAKEDDD